MNDNREAYLLLKQYRNRLTRQQVRTLAGQIRHGKHNEAMNGLAKILNRGEQIGKTVIAGTSQQDT